MPESTQAAHADLLRIWGVTSNQTCGDCVRFQRFAGRKEHKDRPDTAFYTDVCGQAERGRDPTVQVACPGWDATWQACGKFQPKGDK